jgi:hypothetical protein
VGFIGQVPDADLQPVHDLLTVIVAQVGKPTS